jgi:large subunit ribosomal protein L18
MSTDRKTATHRRHTRIRKKLAGTQERPRLSVYRSNFHIYAQVIDDVAQNTLCSASTLDPSLKTLDSTANIDAAKAVGKLLGERAKAKGIETVVFDRGGNLYHGRVEALADGAREAGLEF